MKKILLISVFCLMAFSAGAQWKVSSVESSDAKGVELLGVLDLDDAVLVYATFTRPDNDRVEYSLNRGIAAYSGGGKYKIRKSYNLPIYDEATPEYAVLGEPGDKVNFVMEFEKFPVGGRFDIIQNNPGHDGGVMNFYGIALKQVDSTIFYRTDEFLNAYPVTTSGSYSHEGRDYSYLIHENVCVNVRMKVHQLPDILDPTIDLFEIEVINGSDHGIKFDLKKVSVTSHTLKANGRDEAKKVKIFPEYECERFIRQINYNRARQEAGVVSNAGDAARSASYNPNNSDWAKLGFQVLGDLLDASANNDVRNYMKEHPSDIPPVLQTQGINAGESCRGSLSSLHKSVDYCVIKMTLDEYDFAIRFNFK